jgi:hypothetical protein
MKTFKNWLIVILPLLVEATILILVAIYVAHHFVNVVPK